MARAARCAIALISSPIKLGRMQCVQSVVTTRVLSLRTSGGLLGRGRRSPPPASCRAAAGAKHAQRPTPPRSTIGAAAPPSPTRVRDHLVDPQLMLVVPWVPCSLYGCLGGAPLLVFRSTASPPTRVDGGRAQPGAMLLLALGRTRPKLEAWAHAPCKGPRRGCTRFTCMRCSPGGAQTGPVLQQPRAVA